MLTPVPPAPSKRVLILMAEAGGGHRAAAEAIQEGLDHLYGPLVSTAIVDAWKDHVIWPLNRLVDSYSWLVSEGRWLWNIIWLLERNPGLVDNFLKLLYPVIASRLMKLLIDESPDVIVSVHPLVTFYILRVLKKKKLTVPLVTVVTDMVQGHHTWYQPQATLCLVPTEEARRYALGFGVPPDRVEVVGQPVTLKFKLPAEEKVCLRRKLGLDRERPTVLIAGGGEGFGPIFEMARTVARQIPQAQLIIVTGRNKSLQQRLEAVNWEIPTLIFGFVNNMPDLMGAADVFVTKAGPGSINEAFIARLPLILYHYIPGQEEQNVYYVEKHKAGIYAPHSEDVAGLLADWLHWDSGLLTELTGNAASLARPEAVLTIAHRIYTLAMCRQI